MATDRLTLWAGSLGASNDAEAISILRRHLGDLLTARGLLYSVYRAVPVNTDADDLLCDVVATCTDAGDILYAVAGAFAAHERGKS